MAPRILLILCALMGLVGFVGLIVIAFMQDLAMGFALMTVFGGICGTGVYGYMTDKF